VPGGWLLQFADTYYVWLAGFIVLTGLSFVIKNADHKKLLSHLFLVFATVFVIGQIYTALEAKKGAGNEVFVNSDRAEMALRMTSSMMSLASVLKGQDGKLEEMQSGLYQEAERLLNDSVKLAPESSTLLTKRLILHNETGKPIKGDLALMKKIDTEKAKKLTRLVTSIYFDKKIPADKLPEIRKILNEEMTPGWYTDVLNVQIERVAGTKASYEKEMDKFVENYKNYFLRIVAFFCFVVMAFFIGCIVILVQLFMMPRTPTSPEERAKIASPVDWGWKAVYAVFIGWLSTEFLVVPLMKGLSKDLANIATSQGAFVVALLTAALYLSQNLPAIFYIWFFAVRNHQGKAPVAASDEETPASPPARVSFAEAIRFRWKTERRGPVGLVFAGVLTWYAAIPLVVLAGFIATKFGSQGSSNPIVAVVLSSVKDSDPLAVIMFLITLGVLPGLCEETLFRGFLYTSLRRKFGVFISIVVSAALFSLVHFDLGGALPLFVLGALFAYVFERTKSLLPAMVAHCMWNSGTFLMALTMLG